MGFSRPDFVLYDEPYGHYLERYLNPDEDASSRDEFSELPAADSRIPHAAAGSPGASDPGVGPAALPSACRAPGPKTSKKDAA